MDAPSVSPGGSATTLQQSAGSGAAGREAPSSAGAEDQSEPPSTDAGGGGATPGPTTGGDSNAAGGSSSTPEAAGAAGENGNDAGGETSHGTGGAPSRSAAGEACLACGTNSCQATLSSCEQNPECAPWLACVLSCDSASCSSACDARYSGLSRVYDAVYACLCGACEADCQPLDSCQKHCTDDDALPPGNTAPATLADTGLYTKAGSISGSVQGYEVRFPLWADGANKGRYVYVPSCATIDTGDMDHWNFPVGTRFWKEFAVDDKLIETRLLHRFGSGEADWLYATYGWDAAHPDDPSAARLVEHGQPSANGTLHDIPDPSACPSCHGKLPDRALGFSAIQLSHSQPGLNMQRLSDWGWLSVGARAGFKVPGTPVQQAALGYLHGNCGGCHNRQVDIPREDPMKLRLLVGQSDYAKTDTVLTTIGIPTINSYPELHGKPRIAPHAPDNSTVFLRMSDRNKFPMPPLASKFSDLDGGDAAVEAWIDSL